MNNIKSKKIYLSLSVIIILIASFFIISSYSKADENDGGDGEDNGPKIELPFKYLQPQQQPEAVTPTQSQAQITTVDNSAVFAALIDSDKDGVPDVIDKYPGEDDFAYNLIDKNNNGISDNLEILLK